MSTKLDERTKLIALAKIKIGQKPREVSEDLDISYSQALRLSKELAEAERKNAVLELFNMPEATMDQLLESVKENLALPAEITGASEALEGELQSIKDELDTLKQLDENFRDAAAALSSKIKTLALTTTSPDTVLMLSRSLSELQLAFFAKSPSVTVNNFDQKKFEEFLRD